MIREKEFTKIIIDEACDYCGVMFKGREVLIHQTQERVDKKTRKGDIAHFWKTEIKQEPEIIKVLEEIEFEKCNCDREKIIKKAKSKCINCGKNLNCKTDEQKLKQMIVTGNFCTQCNSKAQNNVNYEPRI